MTDSRRGRVLVIAALSILSGGTLVSANDAAPASSAAPASAAGPGSSGGPSAPAGMRLLWADEFDGPAGAAPDPHSWGYDLGDALKEGFPGWGNQELEWYTRDAANVATDGEGNLVITARVPDEPISCYYGDCQYTSARLLTKGLFDVQYGRVEARIRVPAGTGLWPAFWMLGNDIDRVSWPASGEIDVMENVGRQPNLLYGTLHGPGYSGSNGFGSTLLMDEPLADDFHVFAVDWEPGRVVWTVDGQQYHEATPADVAPNEWVYDHPFFLLLNLAVGGTFGGPVAPDTVFPARMTIDYVRVYQAVD